MENKDYIEIFNKEGSRKMEIVLTFDSPTDIQYKYIVYKEFESSNNLFAGKIKEGENQILETLLSNEEIELVEKVYKEVYEKL